MNNEMFEVSQEANEHYSRGLDFGEAEQFQDAVGEFKLAIRANPGPYPDAERMLAHTYRYWGFLLLQQDEIERGLEYLNLAIEQYGKTAALDEYDAGSLCWQGYIATVISDAWKGEREAQRQRNISNWSTSTLTNFMRGKNLRDLEKKAQAYQQIASKALPQAWQTFSKLIPNEHPYRLEDAMEAACALGEYYSQGTPSQVSSAVSWFKRVAQVKADDFPSDLPEHIVSSVKEHIALAQRRLIVMEEKKQRFQGDAKKKQTKTIITIAVVTGILLITCVCCIIAFNWMNS